MQWNLSIWPPMTSLREAPRKKLQGLFGHCPNGGEGLDPCPNGLGHLIWEELSTFKGAFAWFGGSEPLPGWFGALVYRRIVHVQRGICLFWGVWTLARMVWALMQWKCSENAFAQVGAEIECPRVPVWVKGGGGDRYLGNARIGPATFSVGLPLLLLLFWHHSFFLLSQTFFSMALAGTVLGVGLTGTVNASVGLANKK